MACMEKSEHLAHRLTAQQAVMGRAVRSLFQARLRGPWAAEGRNDPPAWAVASGLAALVPVMPAKWFLPWACSSPRVHWRTAGQNAGEHARHKTKGANAMAPCISPASQIHAGGDAHSIFGISRRKTREDVVVAASARLGPCRGDGRRRLARDNLLQSRASERDHDGLVDGCLARPM